MGIKDLCPLLTEKMRRPLKRDIPLLDFKGQIIAIDALLWAYANMSIANKVVSGATNVGINEVDRDAVIQKWLISSIDTVCLFFSHGITPVFVFDGEHIPDKAQTQDKRKASKLKDRDEINAIKAELKTLSPLDHDPEKIKRLHALIPRNNYISKEELAKLRDLLSGLGIPVLQAIGEAEQLCASMAKEGLVSAVFSKDTDPIAWGCPVVITGLSDYYSKEGETRKYRKVTCVVLSDILDDLGWTQEKLIDLCITLGCDFNTRIRGLGPQTAYNLIQKHESIDNFPTKYDLTSLRHDRCREIFQHQAAIHVIEGDQLKVHPETLQLDRQTFFTQGEDHLAEYSMSEFFGRLRYLFSLVPEVCVGKIPTFPVRRMITLRRNRIDPE